MGAAAQDLPAEVAAEVQRFFSMCFKEMVESGSPTDAQLDCCDNQWADVARGTR